MGIDPITLTGLALAGLGGFAASKAIAPASSAPTPQAPAPPPTAAAAPSQAPQGKPGGGASMQPSFVGASATPSADMGQKTLVGQ